MLTACNCIHPARPQTLPAQIDTVSDDKSVLVRVSGCRAVPGTFSMQLDPLECLPFGLSLAVRSLATAILVVNNVRDLDTDRRAGKLTLAVRLGRPRTRNLYALLIAAAFVAVPVPLLAARGPPSGPLALPAAPPALPPLAPATARARRPALNR